MSKSQKFLGLNDVDRLQARDVLDYLKRLKTLGHRGRTITEIIFNFSGVISERAVLKQVERLKDWGLVVVNDIKVRGKESVVLYEVSEI